LVYEIMWHRAWVADDHGAHVFLHLNVVQETA
jgi:hypothetical protein